VHSGPSALSLALAGLTACGPGSSSGAHAGAPNVLLITIDTLRADRLGFYGYGKPTSPEMDAFAASAVVFEQAEASAPWTLPALASVMTSEVASTHDCWNYGSILDDSFRTLPEHLLAAGYDTAAFASVGFLMPIAADFASQDVSPRLEQSNLAAIPSAQRDAMKAAAERQFRVLGAVANEPRPVDPHTLEELKGLGYLP